MKNPVKRTFLSHFQIKTICLRPEEDQLYVQGLCSQGGKLFSAVYTISYRLFDELCRTHLLSKEHLELSSQLSDGLRQHKHRWQVFSADDFLAEPFLLKNIGFHFSDTPNKEDKRPHIQKFTQIFALPART